MAHILVGVDVYGFGHALVDCRRTESSNATVKFLHVHGGNVKVMHGMSDSCRVQRDRYDTDERKAASESQPRDNGPKTSGLRAPGAVVMVASPQFPRGIERLASRPVVSTRRFPPDIHGDIKIPASRGLCAAASARRRCHFRLVFSSRLRAVVRAGF